MKSISLTIILLLSIFFISGCSKELEGTQEYEETNNIYYEIIDGNSNSDLEITEEGDIKNINDPNLEINNFKTYRSQQECEEETKQECGFVMCDYILGDRTSEETCGEDSTGWISIQ